MANTSDGKARNNASNESIVSEMATEAGSSYGKGKTRLYETIRELAACGATHYDSKLAKLARDAFKAASVAAGMTPNNGSMAFMNAWDELRKSEESLGLEKRPKDKRDDKAAATVTTSTVVAASAGESADDDKPKISKAEREAIEHKAIFDFIAKVGLAGILESTLKSVTDLHAMAVQYKAAGDKEAGKAASAGRAVAQDIGSKLTGIMKKSRVMLADGSIAADYDAAVAASKAAKASKAAPASSKPTSGKAAPATPTASAVSPAA